MHKGYKVRNVLRRSIKGFIVSKGCLTYSLVFAIFCKIRIQNLVWPKTNPPPPHQDGANKARLKVLELAKLTIHAYGFLTVA